MENLPPALQDFIKLRVTYPDATLKELGERANPPLSNPPCTTASAASSRWRRRRKARRLQPEDGDARCRMR